MNDATPVWLSRDGEKFGPYEPGLLRQWVAEGKVARGTFAWRTGMAEWLPLDQVIDLGPAMAPPPPPFGADLPPMSTHPGRGGFDASNAIFSTFTRRGRNSASCISAMDSLNAFVIATKSASVCAVVKKHGKLSRM